jgi:hypothetical protein
MKKEMQWIGHKLAYIAVAGLRVSETEGSLLNPLTPELNPSTQRCLMRFFTGDFGS